MANLIITIISIALVAVAAIMGAYYGGTAFVQGQAKAYANTLATQGDQISAAWSVYAAQNGGTYTSISAIATLSSSPTYLASIPVAPPQVTNTSAVSAWTMAVLSATGTTVTSSTSQNGVYVRLTDDTTGANTCTYVAQIAAGSSANATWISASADLTNAGTWTRKFDCVFYNATSLSVPTTSTPKYVYYRTY